MTNLQIPPTWVQIVLKFNSNRSQSRSSFSHLDGINEERTLALQLLYQPFHFDRAMNVIDLTDPTIRFKWQVSQFWNYLYHQTTPFLFLSGLSGRHFHSITSHWINGLLFTIKMDTSVQRCWKLYPFPLEWVCLRDFSRISSVIQRIKIRWIERYSDHWLQIGSFNFLLSWFRCLKQVCI